MLDLSFRREETSSTICYTLFGKLPNKADFVRVNANHPVAREFDGLIQRAVGRTECPADQSGRERRSSVVDFIYTSQDQQALMVGALIPSRDQAGRLYPLVAAIIFSRELLKGHFSILPIALEVFFDGLRENIVYAVENSNEAIACRQFLERNLRSFKNTLQGDLLLSQSVVTRFMSSQDVTCLGQLLAVEDSPATLLQALLNIAFYQAYLSRFNNRATNQLLRFPLSVAKGEQALIASTWLSLLSALWAVPDTSWRCCSFIRRPPEGGAQLISCIGVLPDSFCSAMLEESIQRSSVLNLAQENEAWGSHRMYAETSYALGRFLADPEFKIAELHQFLADISRQLSGAF